MHAVLLVTLMHDRYLSAARRSNLSMAEAFHWHEGVALFNRKLSGPIQPSERDALWAAAAILGTITFFHIEAKTPEEAWPLKLASSLDLNWLKMSDGKKEIWKITQPLRSDCVFQALAVEHMGFFTTSCTAPGLQTLPLELLMLCGLDGMATTDNNPYHAAASTLAQSWNLDCMQTVFLYFFCFISSTSAEYRELLEQKDHRALLLLAYWYAKVCQTQHWWTWPRAALECQAICIYLERHRRHDCVLQALLQFPRAVCGIAAS